MPVHLRLDKAHQPFTNLDQISGVAVLSLQWPETISEINVKLEAESKSRLAGPTNPRGTYDPYEKNARLEVHKLLYKVSTVFPTPELLRSAGPGDRYTLPPGQHTYPFSFKIPFNNDCLRNNAMLPNLNAFSMQMARITDRHVKKTLPPSLGGFPGMADINYYVKVTVSRPAFFKENFRHFQPFTFIPIDPPREAPNRRESYARRSHHFSPPIETPERPGLFRSRSQSQSPERDMPPPNISVDGRLPDPAIITCCEPLPLRVLVTKKNETSATVFLQLININLISYTSIRAQDLERQEQFVWTILSKSNLKVPLSGSMNNDGTELLEIDKGFWKDIPLPNPVCPSFDTCNISCSYEIEIKVGLQWGTSRSNVHPELQVLPLRMPVQVYSGIAPSQALLDQMATRPPSNAQPTAYLASNLRPQASSTSPSQSQFPAMPPRPASQHRPPPPQQQQQSDHIEPSPGDIPDEAPPSYEDAIADQLAPIDGPRRDYARVNGEGGAGVGDEKGSRLFGDSGSGQ